MTTTLNTEEPSEQEQHIRKERLGLLLALNRIKPNGAIFQGVPAHVKAKRRARGKVAHASRRVNRGA